MVNGRAPASLNFTSSSIRGRFPNPRAAAVGVMIRSVRGTARNPDDWRKGELFYAVEVADDEEIETGD